MSSQSGFSLIELMIVIGIIGILSALAFPSYQNYTQRARFAEIIAIAAPYKTAIAIALQQGAPLNELTHEAHGIPSAPLPTKNLAYLKVDKGIITAKGTANTNNATYTLKPNNEGSQWTVEGTCLKLGLCPG